MLKWKEKFINYDDTDKDYRFYYACDYEEIYGWRARSYGCQVVHVEVNGFEDIPAYRFNRSKENECVDTSRYRLQPEHLLR